MNYVNYKEHFTKIWTDDGVRLPTKDWEGSDIHIFKCSLLSNTSPLWTKDIRELIKVLNDG
jgi:hypothetical protein